MKASDKPEISKKWWTKEKPADIKGKELESALADCEKALGDCKKGDDADAIEAGLTSLSDLSDAVEKTIKKECDKKKHKDLITVLEKYEDLIADQTTELEKAKEALGKDSEKDEDGEEDKGILKPEYLERMIKLLRGGQMVQFCFGLNKQSPEQSRLLLCNKRKPERLYKVLKQTGEFSNRLLTFGTATGDGKMLQFNLSDDAKEPSQIAKLARVYLKSNRDLKFKKLRVIAGGETFDEDMEEGEEGREAAEGLGAGDLQQRLRSAETADLTWKTVRESVADQIAWVQRELNAFDDPDAKSVHDGLSSLIEKFPQPDFAALAKSSDAAAFSKNLESARRGLAEVQRLVGQGGALQAIDGNPFADTEIVRTVNTALSSIQRDLQIA